MGRLIDADKLKQHYSWWGGLIGDDYISELVEQKKVFDTIIDVQPTVDAELVRHGSWYKTYDDEGEAWMCSECCEEWAFEEGHPKDVVYGCNYCPNCGAKMDGERKEDGLLVID